MKSRRTKIGVRAEKRGFGSTLAEMLEVVQNKGGVALNKSGTEKKKEGGGNSL